MANKLLLKRSSVPGKVPTTSDLQYGEISINYADGLLHYRTSSNTIGVLNSGSSYGNTQVAAYLPTSSTITTLDANLGTATTNITTLFSNAASQAVSINSINANIGAYETWANSRITTLDANLGTATTNITTLFSNAATQATTLNTHDANLGTATTNITTLFSNAATQATTLNTHDANLGTATTNITTLFSNAATQVTSINSINANIGAYEIYANANIGTAVTNITNIVTNANANTAAYLLTATGNARFGNIQTTSSGKLVVNDNTNAVPYVMGSGAMYVAGGASFGQDIWVGGNLYVGNLVSQTTSYLTVSAPLVYLQTNVVYPYNYDIGTYSHFIGGPANVYSHSGAVRSYQNNYWGFFSNVKNEPGVSGYVNWADSGIVWDPIKAGELRLANTTVSSSTTTGALTVGGGAGVVGNLYTGGIGYFGSVSSIALTNPLLLATGNSNNFVQTHVQNTNNGGSASGDFIVTADNGTDSTNYIDMGINSSGYNDAAFTIQKALDGYVYVNGSNLTVGTQSTGKNIVFHTGGTLAAQARVMISDIALTANGISILPSSNVTQNLGSPTAYWGTTYTGQLTANTITVGGGGSTDNGSITPGANLAYNLGSSTAYWGTMFGGQLTANTIVASAGTANAAVLTGNVNVAGWIMPFTANASYNLGSSTRWWGTVYGKSVQAQYADLAENYTADADYAPGTVVVFGGSAEVTVTNQSHDTRVAGVVSTNPAYLMNATNSGLPIAMTGRVPCQVRGPVEKGTLLVTSNVEGVAESINNNVYRPGSVLGKALGVITDNSIQTIEVVVGRF